MEQRFNAVARSSLVGVGGSWSSAAFGAQAAAGNSTQAASPPPWIPIVRIRGRSMLPTLAQGQVLVTRPVRGRTEEGDVVVFTAATGRLYVKWIAGMPGAIVTLEACTSVVARGKEVREPLTRMWSAGGFRLVTVSWSATT